MNWLKTQFKKTTTWILVAVFGLTIAYGATLEKEPEPELTPEPIVQVITEKSWNRIVEHKPDGTNTMQLWQGWMSYLDENGVWQEISQEFKPLHNGWTMETAPFHVFVPLYADGVATFHNNNRFNSKTETIITANPMDMTLHSREAGHILGELVYGDLEMYNGTAPNIYYVVYKDALGKDVDLIYYVHTGEKPRLEKLIRFNTAITKDADFSFDIGFPSQPTFSKTANIKTGMIASTQDREIVFRPFRIWDSNNKLDGPTILRKVELIDVNFENNVLTKHIPAKFFTADKVYPIYTDTLATFDSTDADVLDTGWYDNTPAETWTNKRQAAGDGNAGTTIAQYYLSYIMDNGSAWVAITRHHFGFDTSSIGAGNTVSSSTINFFSLSAADSGHGNIYLCASGISGTPAIVTGQFLYTNWDDTADAEYATLDPSTVALNTPFTIQFTDVSFIEVATTTSVGGRYGADYDNVEPAKINGDSQVFIAYSSHATAAYRPRLVVDYSAGAVATPISKKNLILFGEW